MRTSKKSLLIQAALEIIDKKSLDALTYDSLAKASGMSKSGLLYHFPSRAALLLALNEHLASSWRASLLEAAGAPPEELSPPRTLARRRRGSLTKRNPRRPLACFGYAHQRRRRRGVGRHFGPLVAPA